MSTPPDDLASRGPRARSRRKPADPSWAGTRPSASGGRRRSGGSRWLPRWPWSSTRGKGRSGVRTVTRVAGPRTATGGQGRVVDVTMIHARYWMRARRFTWLIIGIWFVVTFVSTWFARDFDFKLFGWPFSFYLAAQGVPILYIVLVTWYGRHMERLDRRYGVEERDLS